MRYEPVRVIGWINAAILAIASIVNQIQTSFDSHSGWVGLGIAALVAVGNELARQRVTPVAKLEDQRYRGQTA